MMIWPILSSISRSSRVPVRLATSRVVIDSAKAPFFRRGELIVYGNAVSGVEGCPSQGEIVEVVDSEGQILGWGPFNSRSMFRVRLLHNNAIHRPKTRGLSLNDSIMITLGERFRVASRKRKRIGLPNQHTNVYRLVNGEGDHLSGLVVDVFNDVAVISSSAAWTEVHKETIITSLKESTDISQVLWVPSVKRLEQDHYDGTSSKESNDDFSSIEIMENGVHYLTNPASGQKTGFFCDQRENRGYMRELVHPGDRVLDLCCYTGGFCMAAALAGAASVTGVDSSSTAIEMAKKNAKLNGVSQVNFVVEDISKFLKDQSTKAGYDVVILDPPKLVPTKAALQNGKRKYKALNKAALRMVSPGGLFLTHSCSGIMAKSGEFARIVRSAAQEEGRAISLLRRAGAAPDHTINLASSEGGVSHFTALFC